MQDMFQFLDRSGRLQALTLGYALLSCNSRPKKSLVLGTAITKTQGRAFGQEAQDFGRSFAGANSSAWPSTAKLGAQGAGLQVVSQAADRSRSETGLCQRCHPCAKLLPGQCPKRSVKQLRPEGF